MPALNRFNILTPALLGLFGLLGLLGLPGLFGVEITSAKDVPVLSGPVIDQANILTPLAKRRIGASLQELQRDSGLQLQVLIIDSLQDEYIESYSIKVTDEWKLGKQGEDRAALLLISVKDRKMRIEAGRGVEGELTDAYSGRILKMIGPYFKAQDYETGLILGLSAIAQAMGGELKSVPISRRERHRSYRRTSPLRGLIFFVILFFIISLFGRGGRRHGSGLLPLLLLMGPVRPLVEGAMEAALGEVEAVLAEEEAGAAEEAAFPVEGPAAVGRPAGRSRQVSR